MERSFFCKTCKDLFDFFKNELPKNFFLPNTLILIPLILKAIYFFQIPDRIKLQALDEIKNI